MEGIDIGRIEGLHYPSFVYEIEAATKLQNLLVSRQIISLSIGCKYLYKGAIYSTKEVFAYYGFTIIC